MPADSPRDLVETRPRRRPSFVLQSITAAEALYAATRRLWRAKVFVLLFLGPLAIGLGGAVSASAVVRHMLAHPSGIRGVSTIVNVYHSDRPSFQDKQLTWSDFTFLRRQCTTLEDLAAWAPVQLTYSSATQGATGFAELVTGSYFDLLGVGVVAGRPLTAADDSPAAEPTAVLSHRSWQFLFSADRGVVGKTIWIDRRAFLVVGVAAPEFRGLFNNGRLPPALWLTFESARRLPAFADALRSPGGERFVMVKGRLKEKVELTAAQTEIARLGKLLQESEPLTTEGPRLAPDTQRNWVVKRMADVRLSDDGVTEEYGAAIVRSVKAMIVLVLLLACLNAVHLAATRGVHLHADLWVRHALGSGRLRTVSIQASEVVVLVALAAGLSWLLALGLLRAIGTTLPIGAGELIIEPTPGLQELAMVLAVAVGLSVASTGVAWFNVRFATRWRLGTHGGSLLGGWRLQATLLAAQVAGATLLLGLSAAFAAQVVASNAWQTGIATGRLAFAELDFGRQGIAGSQSTTVLESVALRLRADPGIEDVAAMSYIPIGFGKRTAYRVIAPPHTEASFPAVVSVTSNVFDVIGLPLLKGRRFDADDNSRAGRVAIVSELASRSLFGTADGVGRVLVITRVTPLHPEQATRSEVSVVGVVANMFLPPPNHQALAAVYVPMSQEPVTSVVVIASGTDSDKASRLAATIPGSFNPPVVVGRAGPARELLERGSRFSQSGATLAAVLGLLSLIMAVATLIGGLELMVGLRRQELGLRLALGASRARLLRSVLLQGTVPTFLGVAVGTLLVLALPKVVAAVLAKSLPPITSWTVLGTAGTLIVVSLASSYLPARDAASSDPSRLLKN